MPFFVSQHSLDCQKVKLLGQERRITELENELAFAKSESKIKDTRLNQLEIEITRLRTRQETFKEFTSELEKVVDTFSNNIQDVLAKFPESDSQTE